MATIPGMAVGVEKPSFAKVAAKSVPKDLSPITNASRLPAFSPGRDRREQRPPATTAITTTTTTAAVATVVIGDGVKAYPGNAAGASAAETTARIVQERTGERKIVEGLQNLKIEVQPQAQAQPQRPSMVSAGGPASATTEKSSKTGHSQTPSEENSQKTDSSSELGTKPPSLDGKSITSGTTFALDEKESLRPDDSASVKAAAEDDDAFSIRGSLLAGSRMGSEVAARVHRLQIGDMPPRTITTMGIPGIPPQSVSTPQSGVSEKQPGPETKLPLVAAATGEALTVNGYTQNPDEKLLEAMKTPKDRFFLLKLEQQVIEFVQDSKDPFMDLPPSNAFCRMLTHKLADYYHMTHSFEAVAGAVRIYRTPFCRIPPALSSIAMSNSSDSSPVPAVLPRKIMRRGEEGDSGAGGAYPSKPTSEAGSDAREKGATAREKLTREEREEMYNRVRERIFGSTDRTETSTPDGDDANGVSRASSVSGKERNSTGKRKTPKQRRDDSESFDTRSSYMVIDGPQQTWAPATPQYYHVGSPPFNGQFQQPYQNALQSVYGPNQSYPPMMPNAAFVPPYNGMPPYPSQPIPQPPQAQRFQPPNPPPMAAPYNAPPPPPPPMPTNMAQPAWQQPAPLSQPAAYPPPRTSPVPTPAGIPYAYGQLPVNSNPHDLKSQHPIPGSYNRQAFNPKTQSFVPANGMMGLPPPVVPGPGAYSGTNPHHGSPQFTAPHVSYNSYQPPPVVPPLGYGGGNGTAYAMSRQGSGNNNNSNNNNNSSNGTNNPSNPNPNNNNTAPHYNRPPNTAPAHLPSKPSMPQAPGQSYGHLPNYGNPASLPQKPST